MQKRRYTHMKAVEGLILSMRQDGMTFQEIADGIVGLTKQLPGGVKHSLEAYLP